MTGKRLDNERRRLTLALPRSSEGRLSYPAAADHAPFARLDVWWIDPACLRRPPDVVAANLRFHPTDVADTRTEALTLVPGSVLEQLAQARSEGQAEELLAEMKTMMRSSLRL